MQWDDQSERETRDELVRGLATMLPNESQLVYELASIASVTRLTSIEALMLYRQLKHPAYTTDGIIEQERLLEIAGLSPNAHRATLRKALRKTGIPFKELNGRIFTTQAAIDATLVGREKKPKSSGPNFDAIASKGGRLAKP